MKKRVIAKYFVRFSWRKTAFHSNFPVAYVKEFGLDFHFKVQDLSNPIDFL